MYKKIFSEEIIVATSQYFATDFTRKLFSSLSNDNIRFTFLILFDGTSIDKINELSDIVDIGLVFKKPIHSLPEIGNCIVNTAKATDAKYLLYSDNDFEYRKGSFSSMFSYLGKFDVVSPVKIDHDYNKFENYFSDSEAIEVIGWNDCAWLIKLDMISYNPYDRFYGPLGFEDAPLQFKLWQDGIKFAVDPKAVAFHHCSQDTQFCFSQEDREKYSKEWDLKAKYFRENNGEKAEWFFQNAIMNAEAIKRFGFPVYIK